MRHCVVALWLVGHVIVSTAEPALAAQRQLPGIQAGQSDSPPPVTLNGREPTLRQSRRTSKSAEPTSSEWARVRELDSGRLLQMSTTSTPRPEAVYFLFADDRSITGLNLKQRELSSEARRVLVDLAREHPQYFAQLQAGLTVESGDLRMGNGIVEVHGKSVLRLSQLIEVVPKENVFQIRAKSSIRGSAVTAAIGVAAGVGAELIAYVLLGDQRCDSNCGLKRALVIVGLPAAGGFLGYFSGHRTVDDVIYQAP
jgi:hypothetical protein